MKFFVSLLTCATALTAKADAIPKNLLGRWKLTGIECKSGPLSEYGMSQKKWIESGIGDQYLVVSKDKVDQEMHERGSHKKPEAFCKTIYSGTWIVHDGIIVKPRLDFKSRDGVGGYKCYQMEMPKVSVAERDWPYEVGNGVLKITHKDVAISIDKDKPARHFCESSSDMSMNYKLEK